jgi:hypothetical protein
VFDVLALVAASPIGVAGLAVAGMIVGSFPSPSIVFAREIGLGVSGIGPVHEHRGHGGLVLQVPVGLLADMFDRRGVMACILRPVGRPGQR